MILLRHAKRIAHDFGRGMDLPGLYSGRFLFIQQQRQVWCLSVSGAVDAQAARRGLQPRMNSRRGRCFLSATKKPGGNRASS